MKKMLSIAILGILMLSSVAIAADETSTSVEDAVQISPESSAATPAVTIESPRFAKTASPVKASEPQVRRIKVNLGGARYSKQCLEVGKDWCARLGRCLSIFETCDKLPERLGITPPGLVRVKNIAGLAKLNTPLPATDYTLQPRRDRADAPAGFTTGGKRRWSNLATPLWITNIPPGTQYEYEP